MNAELEKLISLQKSDTQIKKLKNAITSVDQRRGSLEQEFETRASVIRAMEKQRDDARAGKTTLETQHAELAVKLERTERNLKNSKNPKEYEAAMREKDIIEKQSGELETQILEKGEIIETAEAALKERADEISQIETERGESLKKFETEVEAERRELKTAEATRQKAFTTLPKNLAAVYDRLVKRIRDGVAVAEVKNGACSACSMKLRPQMLVDIKMSGEILNCENCTRILYVAQAETATV